MRFSLSWLKEHLETDASLEEITDRLTALGLEVEEVIDPSAALKDFVVAEVASAEQHPNADKLKLCQVNTGTETLQVVCGAPNARTGIKVAFAPIGSTIPSNGMVLKKTKIRDVESNGMMCSSTELCLGDDAEGIIELPADAVVGTDIVETLELNDPVIDIAITPNRADCLAVQGIARDLAASGFGGLKAVSKRVVRESFSPSVKLSFDFKDDEHDACPLFTGRMIKGIKNVESPDWLKRKLEAAGIKSHNALVDITNYIVVDRARPLHAFDATKIKGNLVVRLAQKGETFIDLKENEQTLEDGMIVIADDSGVLSLAGIMGGFSTGCTLDTTEIFLESALFDPIRIAKAGRALGLVSDARYRFERGVDSGAVTEGLDLATSLIMEICGGEASEKISLGSAPKVIQKITFNPASVEALTGVSVPEEQMKYYLGDLGCKISVKSEMSWEVTAPSWRHDLERSADLVEEVLRLRGYDKIPEMPLVRETDVPRPVLTKELENSFGLRRVLAGRGLVEAVTFSFTSEKMAKAFGAETMLKVANPISQDLAVMRPSLLSNLIEAFGRNEKKVGAVQAGLFEIGVDFAEERDGFQRLVAAGVRNATTVRHWSGKQQAVDLFSVKADAFSALEYLGIQSSSVQVSADSVPAWYHPGQAGILRRGKDVLGVFGAIHPQILADLKIKTPLFAFEIFFGDIQQKAKKKTAKPFLKINPFQSISRDFAFVLDEGIDAAQLVKALKSADRKSIDSVSVFDVFAGDGIPAGKKSVAVEVVLTPQNASFTEQEIQGFSNKIIEAASKIGAEIRA
ncbi:MAG: phenylalanine--tRNA ligase subunit beta [Alphaproteobacteria bacterium]